MKISPCRRTPACEITHRDRACNLVPSSQAACSTWGMGLSQWRGADQSCDPRPAAPTNAAALEASLHLTALSWDRAQGKGRPGLCQ